MRRAAARGLNWPRPAARRAVGSFAAATRCWAEVPRTGPWRAGRCIFMYHQAVVMLIFLNVLFSSVPACRVVAKSCHWVEALCLPDIHHNIF